jgi:hypothetical protein
MEIQLLLALAVASMLVSSLVRSSYKIFGLTKTEYRCGQALQLFYIFNLLLGMFGTVIMLVLFYTSLTDLDMLAPLFRCFAVAK